MRLKIILQGSKLVFVCAGVAAGFLLSACGDKETEADLQAKPEAVEVLYNRARDAMAESDTKEAVKWFEEVERQHPYSEWAPRAELMSAYASYRNRKYDDALPVLQRFVKLHPGHPSAPYAYYLIAMCYYDQITDIGRDQKITEQALQALGEVVTRFPDTDYAKDAALKRDLAIDHLAGKEMSIGMYYEKRAEYLSAINRYRIVVEKYQTTSHTPEALHRLVECYLALGVKEEAKKYAAVLGYNYPGSKWYRYAYADMQGKKPIVERPRKVGRQTTVQKIMGFFKSDE